MADRQPTKETNRKFGVPNTKGQSWKRKEAAGKRYVAKPHAQPKSEGAKVAGASDPGGAPGPGSTGSAAAVPASSWHGVATRATASAAPPTTGGHKRRRAGPVPGAATSTSLGAPPVQLAKSGTLVDSGAGVFGPQAGSANAGSPVLHLAVANVGNVHTGNGISQAIPVPPPQPPAVPLYRPPVAPALPQRSPRPALCHVLAPRDKPTTSEPDIEVPPSRSLYYHFDASSDNGRSPTFERVLPKNSLVERDNDWPWSLLILVVTAGLSFLGSGLYRSYLLLGLGLSMCACLAYVLASLIAPKVVHEYRRTLTITPGYFERTHPQLRIYQDLFKEPLFKATPMVLVHVEVESVYWDGNRWRLPNTEPELDDAAGRLVYSDFQIAVPEHLWASILASISRLTARDEEQVQISVDQAVRSLRPNVSSHYHNEFLGYTVDLSAAVMHAYRAQRYKLSGNWIPDRK